MAGTKQRGRVILIPDNVLGDLPPLPFDKIVRYNAATCEVDAEALKADPDLLDKVDMLVTFKHPLKPLHVLLAKLPNIKFIQALFAGVDNLTTFPLPPGTIISNGSGLHDAPTAELGLTFAMMAARNIKRHILDMGMAKWDTDAYGNNLNPAVLGTLEERKVLIVGMGAIGMRLAKMLDACGAHVEGVATSARTEEGFTVHATETLPNIIGNYDLVISVLPGTGRTNELFNKNLFDNMKSRAWFINVGRGNAVNEADLIAALKTKRIAGAALDVTQVEPLNIHSPLWQLENCIVTPHIGGGGPKFFEKAFRLIAENAAAYVNGAFANIRNVIDPAKGYLGRVKPAAEAKHG